MERDPASKPRKERRPEWQCAVCSSRIWMTRETCRDCEKKRTATDVVIEGTSSTFPPQTPPQKQRTPVQAAEGAYKAACEAGMPQSLLDELLSQVEARKAERDAEKPIGTRLNSARARLQRATTRGAKAKAAMEEATEKFQEAMKELTEANAELQELMMGSIAPEASTGGSDVVFPMAAAMEQLLQTVERSWAPGMQQTDSLAEAVHNGRKVLEHVRKSKSKSPLRKEQELEPAGVPIPPIHHVISDTDTEMDDEATQNAGVKRPPHSIVDTLTCMAMTCWGRHVCAQTNLSSTTDDGENRRLPSGLCIFQNA